MIEYNVPGGKLNRGLTVVHVYVFYKDPFIGRELSRRRDDYSPFGSFW